MREAEDVQGLLIAELYRWLDEVDSRLLQLEMECRCGGLFREGAGMGLRKELEGGCDDGEEGSQDSGVVDREATGRGGSDHGKDGLVGDVGLQTWASGVGADSEGRSAGV